MDLNYLQIAIIQGLEYTNEITHLTFIADGYDSVLQKLIICDNEDFKNGVVITGAFGSAALLENSNKKIWYSFSQPFLVSFV